MLNNGHTQVAIAKEIGVHKSTISRKIKRNGFWRGSYRAIHAQAYTEDRHRFKNKYKKLTQQVTEFIDAKLKQEWSPDQISGYAKLHNIFSISRELYINTSSKTKSRAVVYINTLGIKTRSTANDMVHQPIQVRLKIECSLMIGHQLLRISQE